MPRPQFTLRSLLVAMLVVAAFFGGTQFGIRLSERRERERRAHDAWVRAAIAAYSAHHSSTIAQVVQQLRDQQTPAQEVDRETDRD